MNKGKTYNLVYLMRSIFFGVGISNLFNLALRDTLISILIGTILGITILFIPLGKTNSFLKTIYQILFIVILMITLETYITSFYLENTKAIIINLVTLIFIIYLAKEKKATLYKVSYFLFLYNILTSLSILIFLGPSFDYQNFLPIFKTPFIKIIYGALLYLSFSITPYLALDIETTKKERIIAYLISSSSIFLVSLLTIGNLGINLSRMYRYPEYMVLKNIKILASASKFENILAFIWINDLIMSLALTLNDLRSTFIKSKVKFLYPIIIIILLFLILTGIISNYQIKLIVYQYSFIISFIFFILFFITKKITYYLRK